MNPDWNELEACRDSLREHMEMVKKLRVTEEYWRLLAEKNEMKKEPAGYLYVLSEDHQVFSFTKKDWCDSGSGLWTEIPLFKKLTYNAALTGAADSTTGNGAA